MRRTPANPRLPVVVIVAAAPVLMMAGACASLPALSYAVDEDGGTHAPISVADASDATALIDAASPLDATLGGADAAGEDATAPGVPDAADGGTNVLVADDGGAITGLMCGDAGVGSCAKCPGFPLICKKTTGNTCVAECDECAVGALPCWHCPANGSVKGVCSSVNAKGVLNCSAGNPCSCAVAADCPSNPGALNVCDGTTKTCATCGEVGTTGGACGLLDGGDGVCHAGSGVAPTCQ